jgi:hypothetical protein
VVLSNEFFGDFNPYKEIIYGDWFNDKGRVHHRGEVFIDGRTLYESPILDDLFKPVVIEVGKEQLFPWYCDSDEKNTYIYANFGDLDPNTRTVEIDVRPACFYPVQPGINYITVSGFIMRQAATPWAPPTAEQVGLLGTHWSKGWIIENNVISDSKCVGITLGKDRRSGQNAWMKNPGKSGADVYNEVIRKALAQGWSKENIGSHIVRYNTIYNCEQAGIVGSLGAVFSKIYDNQIYNIWTKRLFSGAEIAGIKIHAAIDVVIRHNRICNTGRGIWLDWMAQGARVTQNLIYDNTEEDLFIEVNHGPFVIDNNVLLSDKSLRNWSEGVAFVHNLAAGYIEAREVRNRATPYMKPHSTKVAGLEYTGDGQERFYNNIFIKKPDVTLPSPPAQGRHSCYSWGLAVYDSASFLVLAGGNVYLQGARPYLREKDAYVNNVQDNGVRLIEEEGHLFIELFMPPDAKRVPRPLITTAFLGKTKVSGLPFENPDGSPLIIDRDYNGDQRNLKDPAPGPFLGTDSGGGKWLVWE